MNSTTIAATPSVQTKKDVEFSFDFDKVLKFSLWLACKTKNLHHIVSMDEYILPREN